MTCWRPVSRNEIRTLKYIFMEPTIFFFLLDDSPVLAPSQSLKLSLIMLLSGHLLVSWSGHAAVSSEARRCSSIFSTVQSVAMLMPQGS